MSVYDRDYRLAKSVLPMRYDLRFDLDLDTWTSKGNAKVALQSAEPGRDIVLHAVDLDITSATVDGRRIALSGPTASSGRERYSLSAASAAIRPGARIRPTGAITGRSPARPMNQATGSGATTGGFGAGWGWLPFMLPYVEQKPLYDSSRVTGATLNGENPGGPYYSVEANFGNANFVGSSMIEVYLCPADSYAPGGASLADSCASSRASVSPWVSVVSSRSSCNCDRAERIMLCRKPPRRVRHRRIRRIEPGLRAIGFQASTT